MKIVATEVKSSKDPKDNCDAPLNQNHPNHKIKKTSIASSIDELEKSAITLASRVSENLPSRSTSKNRKNI